MTNTTPPLRWGLLSTAQINSALIAPIRKAGRSDLIGVASRDLSRAQAYADEWSIPKAYGSYEAMLADPAIDAVYISLPNSMHVEWAVKAADAGKHVLCEKPMVQTLAEFDEVEAAARRNDVTIFEAFMYLHHPQTLKAQAMIAEGKIGRLELIRSWFSFYLPPSDSSNIRLSPDLAGGAMWDVGVYPNSMAITMAGALPEAVWAQQMVGETGVDVTMIGQLRFADEVSAQIACGFRMPFTEGTVITGDEGTLAIPHPWKPSLDGTTAELRYTPRNGAEQLIAVDDVDPYIREVQAMEACVLDGAAPVVPLSRSRDFLRSALALYESARTGKAVSL